MELWIRSQDKSTLINIKRIDYYYYNGEHTIFTDNLRVILGIYKTKERSLEILDEIQNLIYPKNIIKYNDSPLTQGEISQLRKTFKNTPMTIIQNGRIEIEQLGSIVYEMPEE